MVRRACDGAGLLEAFRAAVANLEAHVDEINSLNVYPVPDGDTGLEHGRDRARRARRGRGRRRRVRRAGRRRDQLRGADGRPRQLRASSRARSSAGWPRGSAGSGGSTASTSPTRSRRASRTAYGAVAKPVEGTILTVIRESAAAAVAAAEHSEDIETVLAATVDAAEKSVARTPTLLAILREAGVVDSGGQGLYRLFQGALLHLVGQAPAAGGPRADARRPEAVDARRPRRRGVRLRDDVPAPGRRLAAARRRRASGSTSSRSASPCSSPATPGRSRSTSTTSARTWSSGTA